MNRCLVFIMLAGPSAVAFASETVQCPAAIEVQEQAKDVPEGWLAFEPDTEHPLMSVEFSEGVPTIRATLLPTDERGRSISIWRFTPSEQGYWVSCCYNNTSILISKRLPNNTAACEVEYDIGFAVPLPKRVVCSEKNGGGAGTGATPRMRRRSGKK